MKQLCLRRGRLHDMLLGTWSIVLLRPITQVFVNGETTDSSPLG